MQNKPGRAIACEFEEPRRAGRAGRRPGSSGRGPALLLFALTLLLAVPGDGARAPKKGAPDRLQEERAARRLFHRAEELLDAGERQRAVKMLETVIDQYRSSIVRFNAYLALGKNYFETHEQIKAIDCLRNLEKLKKPDQELEGEARDLYLESLYLIGVCHFQMRQYSSAFSVLRRITGKYPNTVWANQAHYYIGMSHFAQEHWNKAIKSLNLVGTFVDPDSPALEFVEAGHRFYVKILDADLPILQRLGRAVTVGARTHNGDVETIPCNPLTGKSDVFVGYLPTEVAVATPGDGKLQVIGGDRIDVTYSDDNTQEGQKGVPRSASVQVVSTASLAFTLGTFESMAPSAFINQPLFIKLQDVDQDRTDGRDTVTVRVAALYKLLDQEEEDPDTPVMTVDIDKLLAEEENKELAVRDEVRVRLVEKGKNGEGPVHSGVFTGQVRVERASGDSAPNRSDDVLSSFQGDTVMATYVDEVHAGGRIPQERTARVPVAGEIDSTPMAAQDVVADPVIKVKKDLVEAEAYLELARIFKGMRLMDGAASKSEAGLERAEYVLRSRSPIPDALRQNAFEMKWELHLAREDLAGAMATCKAFNKLHPESPLVDHALMGIAKVFMERDEMEEAVKVFRQVLGLAVSHSKPEAQFRMAQIAEQGERPESAIREYRLCAQRYPDSPFAGRALGKVVDYHIRTKDYVVADDLLQQIFMDYRDEDFLDSMLLKWVLVSYRMGNYRRAYEKCMQLVSEYPGSPHAEKAKEIAPRIEQRLNMAQETSEEKPHES